MSKGTSKYTRDMILSTDTKRPEEKDQLTPVDKGQDFVKSGEVAQVGKRANEL